MTPMMIDVSRRGRKAIGLRRSLTVWLTLALLAGSTAGALAVQPPQGQRSQDEFVPVRDIGQQEQLPAAPLLVAAYVVVWLALLVYLWSIWRRLGVVDRELQALTRRLAEKTGGTGDRRV